MSTRTLRAAWVIPTALLLGACWNKGALDVPNVNDPDVARAYGTPLGVEAVIGATYRQIWQPVVNCNDCVSLQAKVLGLEVYSELNNFVMGTRAAIPRGPIVNERGGGGTGANYGTFRDLSIVARTASNGVQALDALIAAASLGNALGSKARDTRARSFGFFTAGVALGGLSLMYDSAAIVSPSVPTDEVPALSSYSAVNIAALGLLDSAIAIATSADATTGTGGFPLDATWISGNALSRDNFVRLIRTYKARFRAGVARSVAERAGVDWALVMADVQNGITADFTLTMTSSGTTWSAGYSAVQLYVGGAWGMMTNLIYGMADTSGAFAQFTATAFGTRDGNFVIRTPDLRFPQGATRAAQQAETAALPLTGRRYLQNRPTGDDNPVAGYGFSQLDHRRWAATRLASNNGPFTPINKVELDMLVAEGHLRASNFAAAALLIDASRARNGLASIGTITSATQQIQGGINACVPKVPQPPSFNTVACGNIWEAMKWEKRMETAMSCDMFCWFVDSRGWGDLVENSNIEWPVPYQEMDARQTAYYSLGGGAARSAPKGTYGY